LLPPEQAKRDSTEFAESIREAVDDLPPELRDVIELLFWGRERPADVARIVGCSRPAVYDRLARALGYLKEALNDDV
jgi:RNA polymerase sigma factor (sigma-70 family)